MSKVEKPEENLNKQEGRRRAIEINLLDVITEDSKGLWEKMSDKGKKLATNFLESIYKMPGINRVAAKMAIAFNQKWVDFYEKKAAKYKDRVEARNQQINAIEEAKKQIDETITYLKQENMPGITSLQLQLKKLDKEKEKILDKKEKLELKFQKNEKERNLFVEKRNNIAERLIGYYDEKLRPLEDCINQIHSEKAELDKLINQTEARHNERLLFLEEQRRRKMAIEQQLRKVGYSDRKIRNVVKYLEKYLKNGYAQIEKEKEQLKKKSFEIEEKLVKVEMKADPYKKKREEFIRVKERKQIEFTKEGKKEEKVEKSIDSEKTEENADVEKGFKLAVKEIIKQWNEYLEENHLNKFLIEPDNFCKKVKVKETTLVDVKDDIMKFKADLENYYQEIGQDFKNFSQEIDHFVELISKEK